MIDSMVFPEFAYTQEMQGILFLVMNVSNFLFGYVLTVLLLAAYGEKASPRKICWVAFLRFNLAQSAIIYLPYLFLGDAAFKPILPFLATPNPVFALWYYYLCVKVLKLSKYRSVHVVLVAYLFSVLSYCLYWFVNYAVFPQGQGPYNYLLDLMAVGVNALIKAGIYFYVMPLLGRRKIGMVLGDSLVVKSLPRKLGLDFLLGCLAYGLVVWVQSSCIGNPYDMLELSIIMGLGIAVGILAILVKADRVDIQNKTAHINLLSNSIDEFRGVKHDFYNVLGTYSGFISIGNLEELQTYHEKLLGTMVSVGDQMDMSRKLTQNPSLVALIAQKVERANECGVYLRVNLLCNIEKLYMEDISICRVVGNLLDNAIEAAAESKAKQSALLMEPKPGGSILIVVSNTTLSPVDLNAITVPGMTTKEGHSGLGLVQVRNILSKYPNCSLRFEYYNNQFIAYIELHPVP